MKIRFALKIRSIKKTINRFTTYIFGEGITHKTRQPNCKGGDERVYSKNKNN